LGEELGEELGDEELGEDELSLEELLLPRLDPLLGYSEPPVAELGLTPK